MSPLRSRPSQHRRYPDVRRRGRRRNPASGSVRPRPTRSCACTRSVGFRAAIWWSSPGIDRTGGVEPALTWQWQARLFAGGDRWLVVSDRDPVCWRPCVLVGAGVGRRSRESARSWPRPTRWRRSRARSRRRWSGGCRPRSPPSPTGWPFRPASESGGMERHLPRALRRQRQFHSHRDADSRTCCAIRLRPERSARRVDVDAEVERRAALLRAGNFGGSQSFQSEGRIIELRCRPLAEGGFVALFTDITEGRRMRQVLRDARDALLRGTSLADAVPQRHRARTAPRRGDVDAVGRAGAGRDRSRGRVERRAPRRRKRSPTWPTDTVEVPRMEADPGVAAGVAPR